MHLSMLRKGIIFLKRQPINYESRSSAGKPCRTNVWGNRVYRLQKSIVVSNDFTDCVLCVCRLKKLYLRFRLKLLSATSYYNQIKHTQNKEKAQTGNWEAFVH